jgi:hypothetical protein
VADDDDVEEEEDEGGALEEEPPPSPPPPPPAEAVYFPARTILSWWRSIRDFVSGPSTTSANDVASAVAAVVVVVVVVVHSISNSSPGLTISYLASERAASCRALSVNRLARPRNAAIGAAVYSFNVNERDVGVRVKYIYFSSMYGKM